MSRHTPLDFSFDYDVYIDLVKKAQGSRSQKKFASDVGITTAYLNRALTGRYDKPFMPNTLRKIAMASEGRVDYKDLLTAAGYDYRKYMKPDDIHRNTEFSFERQFAKKKDIDNKVGIIRSIISGALADKGLLWSGITRGEDLFDFRIRLCELPISEWGFIFMDYTDIGIKPLLQTSYNVRIPGEMVLKKLLNIKGDVPPYKVMPLPVVEPDKYDRNDISFYCTKLALGMERAEQKISLVTTDKNRFLEVGKVKLEAFSHYISIVLVDIESFKVVEEKCISPYAKDERVPLLV